MWVRKLRRVFQRIYDQRYAIWLRDTSATAGIITPRAVSNQLVLHYSHMIAALAAIQAKWPTREVGQPDLGDLKVSLAIFQRLRGHDALWRWSSSLGQQLLNTGRWRTRALGNGCDIYSSVVVPLAQFWISAEKDAFWQSRASQHLHFSHSGHQDPFRTQSLDQLARIPEPAPYADSYIMPESAPISQWTDSSLDLFSDIRSWVLMCLQDLRRSEFQYRQRVRKKRAADLSVKAIHDLAKRSGHPWRRRQPVTLTLRHYGPYEVFWYYSARQANRVWHDPPRSFQHLRKELMLTDLVQLLMEERTRFHIGALTLGPTCERQTMLLSALEAVLPPSGSRGASCWATDSVFGHGYSAWTVSAIVPGDLGFPPWLMQPPPGCTQVAWRDFGDDFVRLQMQDSVPPFAWVVHVAVPPLSDWGEPARDPVRRMHPSTDSQHSASSSPSQDLRFCAVVNGTGIALQCEVVFQPPPGVHEHGDVIHVPCGHVAKYCDKCRQWVCADSSAALPDHWRLHDEQCRRISDDAFVEEMILTTELSSCSSDDEYAES